MLLCYYYLSVNFWNLCCMNIPWDEVEMLYPRAQDGVLVALRDVGVSLMELTSEVRFCYAMAQFAHETGGFAWLKELGDDRYFRRYEGRKDLGNVLPGDGIKYPGRGLIHVTGKSNYMECAEWTGLDCVKYPEILEEPVAACQSTAWYWMTRNLNDLCDRREFKRLTKKINGGYTGYSGRLRRLAQISEVMGVQL